MKKLLVILLSAGMSWALIAQDAAFTNEVHERNGIVYFRGKPFTGILYSDDEGIPNKCECTLEAYYRNGVLHGMKRQWYRNGKKKFEGRYVNGQPTGVHLYYYSNGRLKKKAVYRNGKLISSVLYNRDGTPKGSPSRTTVSERKKKSPVKREPEPAREPDVSREDVSEMTTETEDGYRVVEEQFPDQSKKRIILYLNDIPVKDTLFYLNGFPKEIKIYDAGELVHRETYYEDGILHSEENFSRNRKHGIQKEFYPNRKLKRLEVYEEGLPVHLVRYGENGQLLSDENFRSGRKHGLQQKYDLQGNLIETARYEDGRLIRKTLILPEGKEIITVEGSLKKTERFDRNGNLLFRGFTDIQSGQPDSLHVYFGPDGFKQKEILYRSGQIVRTGTYRNGRKHGVWKQFLPGGKGLKVEVFENGKKISEREVLYERQIKRMMQQGDYLFVRRQFYPKEYDEYVLVRLPQVEDKERTYIIRKILGTFVKNGMHAVKDTTGKGDFQVDWFFEMDSLATRLRKNQNKYLYLIYATFHLNDFHGKPIREKWMVFAKHPSGNLHRSYVRDKKDAYFKTLEYFAGKFDGFIRRNMPLKVTARPLQKRGNLVYTMVLNAGRDAGIRPNMKFYTTLSTDKGPVEVEVEVEKVLDRLSNAAVRNGSSALFKYFKHHRTLMLKSK